MWIQQPLGQGYSAKTKGTEEGFINSLKVEKIKLPK
jgi:hypothetical protein